MSLAVEEKIQNYRHMKLDHLYSLRNNFTVIGLTGRTGAGCTQIAEILSNSFESLQQNGLRNEIDFEDYIFRQKYSICKNFLKHERNWIRYEVIQYKKVLLFYILNKYGGNRSDIQELFKLYYREDKKDINIEMVEMLMRDIISIDLKFKDLINDIKSFESFSDRMEKSQLQKLNDIFWGDQYKDLSDQIFKALEQQGYFRSRMLLHKVACNIRKSGDPKNGTTNDIKNIYSIAELINKIIKARSLYNDEKKPTKIVIDSLRNSLEIMFFKERFSAFYMIATKDVLSNAREQIKKRLKSKIKRPNELSEVIEKLFDLDETEYLTNDFSRGLFSSPDVENCIQKSDFHIVNLNKEQVDAFYPPNNSSFLTKEEQIMKLVSLIEHPGLITPSSTERAMQIANTAKLNSGCISRKVGAVITDTNYYVKAVGWNDVAKGHTPCNLRTVADFLSEDDALNTNQNYSEFEKGHYSEHASFKYKAKKPGNFKEALVDYFKENFEKNREDLKGKNCSFCFKTVHNYYEGQANQVHTRSLHAEENSMLQITKIGGSGIENGYLFTTASPCELCSKKAYQLGIKTIYFIDPYPGIAVDQILKGGKNQPRLLPFSGAIGNAYHKLYETFMSTKDEISMTLEINPKKNLTKEFSNVLSKSNNDKLEEFAKSNNLSDEEVFKILLDAVQNHKPKTAP